VESAQYPEERSFGQKDVAVVRCKALRDQLSPAIRQKTIASYPPYAPCGAPPPLMFEGKLLTPRTLRRREITALCPSDTTPGKSLVASHQFIDRNNGERLLTPL
jgi:hypothetical protein